MGSYLARAVFGSIGVLPRCELCIVTQTVNHVASCCKTHGRAKMPLTLYSNEIGTNALGTDYVAKVWKGNVFILFFIESTTTKAQDLILFSLPCLK